MTRILIAEDDTTINGLIKEYLTGRECLCTQAFSGTEAKLLFEMESTKKGFDLVLLDLMLPGMTGEELAVWIREKSQVPIIVLSAKTALSDKVELLGSGADDYLTKPFELEELWARIQVQLRHSHREVKETLSYRDWILDPEGRTFTAKGCAVELTLHEFGIVELLVRHPKKVYTKQEIFEAVWQQDYFVEDKTINVHISNIRAKLKKTGTDDYIRTVWGMGFKLAE